MIAQHVSKTLRLGGVTPLGSGAPRTREGVRVTRGLFGKGARVSIDIDGPSAADRMYADVRAILTSSGYDFTEHHDDGVYAFTVHEH